MHENFDHGYALLIGIGDYHHLRKLEKTINDVKDLSELLVNHCGYPSKQIALLKDNDATKGYINDKLDWLARNVTQDDTVVIFFSGHGAQRIGGFERGEYLCAVDTDWYNLNNTGISSNELTTALQSIQSRKMVVFLDACHAGGVGDPRDSSLHTKIGLSDESYEVLAAGEGRVVVASCKPSEVAWEFKDMRNGLFSHYLLAGLSGEGVSTKQGHVYIFELFDYLGQVVSAHAKRRGVNQTPFLKAHGITQNFAIAPVFKKNTESLGPDAELIENGLVDTTKQGINKNLIPEKIRDTYMGLAIITLFTTPTEASMNETDTSFDEIVQWAVSTLIDKDVERQIATLLDLIEIQRKHYDRARRTIALMGGEPFATPPQAMSLEIARKAIREHKIELKQCLEKAYGKKIITDV